MAAKSTASCLMLLTLVILNQCTFAQTAPPAKKQKPEVEMLMLQVLVLDPDGHPVEGATVKPRGLRTKVERVSWWGWDEAEHGKVPEILSNAEGIAEVPYPKFVMEKLETGTLNLTVTHPDFVLFDDDRSVDDAPARVQLERGFRIAVTAVDADTGQPIKADLYGLPSVQASGKWELKKNGMLVSPTLEKMDCILRVVHLEKGQPTKFSNRIEINPGERSRILLKNVKLALGVRVVGKLDESVPRPVKHGHVAATVNRWPGRDDRNWRNSWNWMDKAKVEADGTFVFESMPTDEVLQLISVCDGWVPGKANKQDVLKYYPQEVRQLNSNWGGLPQLVKLENMTTEVTLPMKAARSVRITVKGPNGQTLPNVQVGSSPNQYWFDVGSQLLGDASSSRERLVSPPSPRDWRKGHRYLVETDESGTAVMHNLPGGNRPGRLGVFHDDYELSISGNDRDITFTYANKGVTDVTVKLQKKGTEVLDGSQANAVNMERAALREATGFLKGAMQNLWGL